MIDIEANLQEYITNGRTTSGLQPSERYASFDYCFNYFQSFREDGRLAELVAPAHLQTSCLEIGFYLAGWGMLRGSSFLLNKSAKFYEPLIAAIASAEPALWDIDAHRYTPANVDLLLECKDAVRCALGRANDPSDTLVSKIMLGVFGNVPAFDTAFRTGFGVSAFGKRSIGKIADFYRTHADIVDKHRIPTMDFETGAQTHRLYTRAKVIDMVFFIEGYKSA
jgi:hypothetical protein